MTPRTDSRNDEILRAALGVFLEQGVEGASIEEIRARSGASVGSLYHRFGSKRGIAAALYVGGLADYQRAIRSELERGRSTEATVRSLVVAHLRWIAEHDDLARFLFMDRDQGLRGEARAELRALNDSFFGGLAAWVRPRVDAGEIRDLPADVLHALWFGPAQELARHALAGRVRGAIVGRSELLADAAWAALRGDAAPPQRSR